MGKYGCYAVNARTSRRVPTLDGRTRRTITKRNVRDARHEGSITSNGVCANDIRRSFMTALVAWTTTRNDENATPGRMGGVYDEAVVFMVGKQALLQPPLLPEVGMQHTPLMTLRMFQAKIGAGEFQRPWQVLSWMWWL